MFESLSCSSELQSMRLEPLERNQSKVAEVITELILAARLRQSRKVIFIIGREPGSFSATGPLCLLLEWPLLWHPLFVYWIPKT